jgi:hypothetical protein
VQIKFGCGLDSKIYGVYIYIYPLSLSITHTYTHTHTHTITQTQTHSHTQTHSRTHARTHTHTHTQHYNRKGLSISWTGMDCRPLSEHRNDGWWYRPILLQNCLLSSILFSLTPSLALRMWVAVTLKCKSHRILKHSPPNVTDTANISVCQLEVTCKRANYLLHAIYQWLAQRQTG